MNIVLLNGSPKAKNSASGSVLEELAALCAGHTMETHQLRTRELPAAAVVEQWTSAEALVLAFPLYVDGIPAHLLDCLCQLESTFRAQQGRGPVVYAIANCGFFEGGQNRHALAMVRHWCRRAGLTWGQGMGLGGGGMLVGLRGVPVGQGPLASFSAALGELAGNVAAGAGGEDRFVNPGIPRLAYQAAAQLGWRQQAKTNGLCPRDLARRW